MYGLIFPFAINISYLLQVLPLFLHPHLIPQPNPSSFALSTLLLNAPLPSMASNSVENDSGLVLPNCLISYQLFGTAVTHPVGCSSFPSLSWVFSHAPLVVFSSLWLPHPPLYFSSLASLLRHFTIFVPFWLWCTNFHLQLSPHPRVPAK